MAANFTCVLTADNDDQESGSDGDAEDEHDLDEEVGDLGVEECDKLDEQMWGSDEDEPIKVTADSFSKCKKYAVYIQIKGSI